MAEGSSVEVGAAMPGEENGLVDGVFEGSREVVG